MFLVSGKLGLKAIFVISMKSLCSFIKESLLTIRTYEDWKGRRKAFDPSFTKR